MPQIKEYTARTESFRADDRGTNAREMGARRTGALYNQAASEIEGAARAQATAAGDVATAVASASRDATDVAKNVEDYLGHREVSKGAAESSKLYANLSDAWDKTAKSADPNDPTVAEKFRTEVLEPSLQNFNEAYSNTPRGRNWSESHVATMRQHFTVKTGADMGTLAAQAVEKNVRELGNSSSNIARQSPDFHTIDYQLNDVDGKVAAIIDASPNLKGAEAAKVRMALTQKMQEQIVKAGALGAMERSANPEAAVDTFAKRYPTLVNGQEIEQFSKAARYYKRLDESERRSARQQADYEDRKTFHIEVNKLESEMMPDDPSEPLRMPKNGWQRLRDLSSTPGAALEPGRLKAMTTQMQAVSERLNKTDPLARVSHETTMDLLQRIRSTDEDRLTDVTPIYEAFGKGKLSRTDLKFLTDEFKNIRTPEGERLSAGITDLMKAVKPAIDKSNPLMGKIDQDGPMNVYRFEQDLRRKIAEYRKAGKNPHDLLDPSKPEFVGSATALTGYQKSLDASVADTARRLGARPPRDINLTGEGKTITGIEYGPNTAPAPRKSGETPDAYLKRIGVK